MDNLSIMRYSLSNIFEWVYGGVDHSLEGNGGPVCLNYSTPMRRVVETIFLSALASSYTIWGYNRLEVPKKLDASVEKIDRAGKRILLVLICLTFGCEIGFKFATKTLIYLLNPCHVVTIIQIYLLAAPPTPMMTAVFRCQMHCLNGAILAIAFPVLNTRLLPFEMEVYFIQHILMIIIPFYLLKIGGVYTMEKVTDFSWSVMTLGIHLLYHFYVLQALGMLTEVNLNNMLCPAVSDPFRGPHYRIWATVHQSVVISTIGKVFYILTIIILRLFGHKIPGEVTDNSCCQLIKCPACGCNQEHFRKNAGGFCLNFTSDYVQKQLVKSNCPAKQSNHCNHFEQLDGSVTKRNGPLNESRITEEELTYITDENLERNSDLHNSRDGCPKSHSE